MIISKSKNIIAFCTAVIVIIFTLAFDFYMFKYYLPNLQVKENRKNGEIVSIEYNGDVYYPTELYFASNTEFILGDKICEKPNLILPRAYYSLENDEDNVFLYQSVFRDSKMFTKDRTIYKTDDLKCGNITSVLITKNSSPKMKRFVDEDNIVYFCKSLENYKDDEYEAKTFTKNTGYWYYISFSYSGSAVCPNSNIIIGNYDGEYYLSTDISDYTFTGVPIKNEQLTHLLDLM